MKPSPNDKTFLKYSFLFLLLSIFVLVIPESLNRRI